MMHDACWIAASPTGNEQDRKSQITDLLNNQSKYNTRTLYIVLEFKYCTLYLLLSLAQAEKASTQSLELLH
jgi:hypothetical protein